VQHYQEDLIGGLQEYVLARPSQKELVKVAKRSMRDPLAPVNINTTQKKLIRRDPELLKLRAERDRLKMDLRFIAGTLKKSRALYPNQYRRHKEVVKELDKKIKALRREAKKKAKENYFRDMPNQEIDKQIGKLVGTDENARGEEESEEISKEENDWELPAPEYAFPERARIVDAFYGPDSDNSSSDDAAILRRIQVTKDMIALCKLQEPPRTRNGNWNDNNNGDETDDEIKSSRETSVSVLDERNIPTKVCIICPDGHEYARPDHLRRHLIIQHLSRIAIDGLQYNKEICTNVGDFDTALEFLNHAAKVHNYDLQFKKRQLDEIAEYDRDAIMDEIEDLTSDNAEMLID
jgi:hypothetical protein